MTRSIAIIGAPSSAGAYSPGQEDGPQAMRDAGLRAGLEARGFAVADQGDAPRWRWRPDHERLRAMNVPAVVANVRATAQHVAHAAGEGHLPLVLGGDCTTGLGTVLGLRASLPGLRLVYLDAHPDLNTPESVPDGALDWMGVAHLLGIEGTLPELAGLAGGSPLLAARDLVLLANSPSRTTAHEATVIAERQIANIPQERVAADPAGAAREALAHVGDRPFLVHLDTDVVDFADLPLAENTDRNVGLPFETVARALDVLLAGEGVSALTITELNPHHGASDGATVRRFVDRLVSSFAFA
ncbi:MAG: arginase family protein [Gaiellales bacterium]